MQKTITDFQEHIDKQILCNKGKNLFHNNIDNEFYFLDESITVAAEIIQKNNKELENLMVDYTADKALQEFARINQYYSFNKNAITELRSIYSSLFQNIKKATEPIELIAKNHYKNLIEWLKSTNPFSETLYSQTSEYINPVACFEYSSELQVDVLQLQNELLLQPILDIGCGKQGNLVTSLCEQGYEAIGFDRFVNASSNLINADWLEFEYGINKWGTIISNLGFTNHFKHHHLRSDGNFIEYAKVYMKILNSLKEGGSFYYAPDLPFIEQYLDCSKYEITKKNIGKLNIESVEIKKMKLWEE